MSVRRIGGAVWRFAEDADPSPLAALAGTFDRFIAEGTRIKENPVRTVALVDLPEVGPVYAKRYRYRSWKDRLRYLLIPTKAMAEWKALRRFRRLGLATAEPLAVAVERRGPFAVSGALVTRRIAGAVPAATALSDPARGTSVRDAIARFARRLTALGIWHRDLHLGNFLVADRGGDPEVFLLDLHTCRFLPVRLPWAIEARVLGKLLHSLLLPDGFGPAAGEGEGEGERDAGIRAALGFLEAYFEDRAPAIRRFPKLLLRALAIEARRLRSRSKRSMKHSSRFRVERAPGRLVRRRATVPLDAVLAVAARDRTPQVIVKARPGRRVGLDRLGDTPVCVKEVRYGPLSGWFRGGGALRRAWWAAEAFSVRGIPTPEAIALVEERGLLGTRRGVLITRWIEGAAPLVRFLRENLARGGAAPARFAYARELARIVRRLHAYGLYHRDLAPQNWLCVGGGDGAAPRFLIVDLESVHRFRRLTARRRRQNLIDLGNLPEGHVTWSDRARFLVAYGGRAFLRDRRTMERLRDSLACEYQRIIERWTREEILGGRWTPPGA
ncbi:MAG: hypothetical protein JXP34_22660 [Planctomycetes bacterium]|nr:hypothetical protein [Planctomycetota bacterium]